MQSRPRRRGVLRQAGARLRPWDLRGDGGQPGLCLHRLTIPPGQYGRAHLHEAHESPIFVLEGEAEFWWGDRLEHHDVCRPGDFVYIPAGVPHLPANLQAEPCEAVVARTDAGDQESVVLRPDLDELIAPPML